MGHNQVTVVCKEQHILSCIDPFYLFRYVSLLYTFSYLGFLTCSMDCASDQDYVKITKKTTSQASHESFQIVSGFSVLFSSSPFKDNEVYVNETCLTTSSTHIYTLVMSDSAGDGWQGSWITLSDINENAVFKSSMIHSSQEGYQFALYSPIHKNDTWKFSNSYHSQWATNSFNDNQWTSITLGSTSGSSPSTQYFRKSFNGITGMASIDIQFYYSHGIIAYINGIEVFRDNMPDGTINHSTLATNSYSYSDYRGTILPAFYGEQEESVLSVERHFTSIAIRVIDFNCFVSYGAGISGFNPCSVYSHPISVTGTFDDSPYSVDYNHANSATKNPSDLPAYIIASFGNVVPFINSIRFYPYQGTNCFPSSFVVEGGDSENSTSWHTILTQYNQTYIWRAWKQWTFSTPSPFQSIKFIVNSVLSPTTAILHEFQFMICNQETSLSLPPYSFFIAQQTISLTIDMNGITNCVVAPPLPQGLTVNPSTCTISGYVTSSYSSVHTVTAVSGKLSHTRPITLTILVCYESLSLHLIHSTQSTQGQGFTIRNTVTSAILKQVSTEDQLSIGDTHYGLCTSNSLEITLSSSTLSWSADSYIYLYQIHSPDEEELLLKARYDSLVSHTYTFSVDNYKINRNEQWYYRMSSIPDNWFDNDLSGWSSQSRYFSSIIKSDSTLQEDIQSCYCE